MLQSQSSSLLSGTKNNAGGLKKSASRPSENLIGKSAKREGKNRTFGTNLLNTIEQGSAAVPSQLGKKESSSSQKGKQQLKASGKGPRVRQAAPQQKTAVSSNPRDELEYFSTSKPPLDTLDVEVDLDDDFLCDIARNPDRIPSYTMHDFEADLEADLGMGSNFAFHEKRSNSKMRPVLSQSFPWENSGSDEEDRIVLEDDSLDSACTDFDLSQW